MRRKLISLLLLLMFVLSACVIDCELPTSGSYPPGHPCNDPALAGDPSCP